MTTTPEQPMVPFDANDNITDEDDQGSVDNTLSSAEADRAAGSGEPVDTDYSPEESSADADVAGASARGAGPSE